MRRTVTLLMALLLLLTAAACSSDGAAKEPAGESTKQSIEEAKTEFEPGIIDENNVYTNSSMGVCFTAPEGWIFASEEEIGELFAESATSVYDMAAQSPDQVTNLVIMYENLAKHIDGTSYDEDKFLDDLMDALQQTSGESYEILERRDMTLGSESYRHQGVFTPDYGLYQEYVVRRIGKYMIAIICTGFDEDILSTLEGQFS